MPPMQTLDSTVLDFHYSVWRDAIAPTLRTSLGGGASQFRRLYERPVYQFRLQAMHEEPARIEALYGFFLYHQGDTPFWFTGKEWGAPSTPVLVGFGAYDYRYDSGHRGTAPLVSFSPRKASLVVYLVGGMQDRYPELFERLGPHKAGKGCLYVKRLGDVDHETLRALVDRTVRVHRGADRRAGAG